MGYKVSIGQENAPCYGCPRRKVGCHSGCPDYDKYRLGADRRINEQAKEVQGIARVEHEGRIGNKRVKIGGNKS